MEGGTVAMQAFARTRLLYIQCSWSGQSHKVTPSASETRLIGSIYQLELAAENEGGVGTRPCCGPLVDADAGGISR